MRLLTLALILVAACAAAAPRQVAPILAEAHDSRSFARPEIARVTHVALDLDADFAAQRMAGTATLDIQAAPGAREIVLDSKGLEIQAVTDAGRPAAPLRARPGRRGARPAAHRADRRGAADPRSATAARPAPRRCNG